MIVFGVGGGGVITGKYGVMEGRRVWSTRSITLPFGCGLWSNILKG